MYKRFELHNHTNESDGSLTVEELIDFMIADTVDAFALTDHNTISGHKKAQSILQTKNPPIECVYGMEYTTYYGHILCLNLYSYIPWENINPLQPEKLFTPLRQTGALIGVAHPFSYGAPIAQGCKWEMQINDYTAIDFIEIINNPEPQHINEKGIDWWEQLCLQGFRIAMTAGMDLHGRSDFAGQFAVYVDTEKSEPADKALQRAIKTQKTYITKGPVFTSEVSSDGKNIQNSITDCVKPGFNMQAVPHWTVEYTSPAEKLVKRLNPQDTKIEAEISCFTDSSVIIAKLYAGEPTFDSLVAIAPVIYR
ncbi:PHP domain-containing protein [Treponema phagedenis]|uniref:PHP domain protein n=1 Tax=Treponema phagedenis TaxID=162 RepID=A0A0B7GXB6_TREPH|nr:CehA/McbA family metallohydrolase [Treponema phagedenis]NVP24997.1 CehA/McbA family metallohydrolase [Treponema phagedenis]QKS91438.1 CehA/McbA family metallohydrolase [Treponema phagedenis]QLC59298.1 CehA/McbA family metallohydrolase [Treponema phagedenis]QSH98705.1 PHP domain-containing protein [Treponema phagedenis]CEM61291.1 PHP domain protein [Treponema phagedenis]